MLQRIAMSLQDSLGDGNTRQVVGAIAALAARQTFPLLPSLRSAFIKFMVRAQIHWYFMNFFVQTKKKHQNMGRTWVKIVNSTPRKYKKVQTYTLFPRKIKKNFMFFFLLKSFPVTILFTKKYTILQKMEVEIVEQLRFVEFQTWLFFSLFLRCCIVDLSQKSLKHVRKLFFYSPVLWKVQSPGYGHPSSIFF